MAWASRPTVMYGIPPGDGFTLESIGRGEMVPLNQDSQPPEDVGLRIPQIPRKWIESSEA